MILALDSSEQVTSVTLFGSGRVIAEAARESNWSTEFLLPLVHDALTKSGRALQEITEIAVCTGPGSFTGIRNAITAALALSAALEVPATGVSCFVGALYESPDIDPHTDENVGLLKRANGAEFFGTVLGVGTRFCEILPVTVLSASDAQSASVSLRERSAEVSRVIVLNEVGAFRSVAIGVARAAATLADANIDTSQFVRGRQIQPLYAKGVNALTVLERRSGGK